MSEQAEQDRVQRWHGRMLRALRAGDSDTCLRAAARLIGIDPGFAEAHFVTGICQLQQGHAGRAADSLARATELVPDKAEYWSQLANCLALSGQPKEALRALRTAASLPIADPFTHHTLGQVLARLGRLKDAAAHYEAATRLAPENTEFQYLLAQTLIYTGDLERASDVLQQLLRRDPDHARAHVALADLPSAPPPDQRIRQLEDAIARTDTDSETAAILSQALARTLEAAGRTEDAFAVWEQSKRRIRNRLGYSFAVDRPLFSVMEQAFNDTTRSDKRPGDPSAAPIFVVGMPRTGTTLVERILGSHSSVAPGGELPYFAQSLSAAWQGRTGEKVVDEQAIAAALAMNPGVIGANYLANARLHVDAAVRFVDKMPFNFFFIGFIRRSLPGAKIVCLRRDPLDTCLANFRQLFSLQHPHHRYSLALEDTAEYVAHFERLMAHWHRLYPGAVLDLQYEQLVADPETEVRRLLQYVGLEYEPAVLQFDRSEAPVATASAVQVRRPLNADSVGAWQRYAKELEPVRQRLIGLGIVPGETSAESAS